MGMIKKGQATEVPSEPKAPASGTDAAIGRLQSKSLKKSSDDTGVISRDDYPRGSVSYKPRDFDKEARGKTRCACFNAAITSPSIAGLQFKTLEDLLELVKKAADEGVKYSFGE